MSDPRFAVPPSTRRFYPPWPKTLAFLALGLAAAGVRVLTLPRRRRTRRPAGSPERIVVLEPYGMGDVVALQPLVRAWCEAGHEVVACVRAEWQPILLPHPNLTCLDLRPAWASTDGRAKRAGGLGGAHGLIALSRRLASPARGARGVDVRGDVRSLLLLYLAGCGRVETLTRYFAANDCPVFPGAARRHPVDRTVERWRLNGVFAAEEGLALAPPTVDHLRELPENAGPGRDALGASAVDVPAFAVAGDCDPPVSAAVTPALRVGLVPLTPWEGKRWMPEFWREMVEGLRSRGFEPVPLCGPGEREAAAEALGGAVRPEAVRESATVRDWVSGLAGCGAVVCVNTGPMHLAAALGIPTVVIEGSSRLPLWAPASAAARVVHHQDVAGCAPCHQAGSAEACARRCMARVRPTEAWVALDDLMNRAIHAGDKAVPGRTG